MMSATSRNSSSPNPRVASAGVPIRSPEETIGGRGSNGTALRFTVMPIRVQPVLALLAVQVGVPQVDQHQVHVGAAADHRDPGRGDVVGEQPLGDDLGALQRALLPLAERRLGRQLERHRLGGDHVLQRAALLAGEDRGVDLLGDAGVVGQDDPAARAAERLVRGGGDDVGVRHRVGVQPGRDQAGEVGHVHHQVGADQVGDPAELGEVELPGVGRPAGDDQLRPVLDGQALDLGHVDAAWSSFAHLVGDHVVELAGEVDPHAVGEVAAVGQRQAEDGVARLEQGEHRRGVGLGAGVGLHVGELGTEQCLDPVDGQLLDDVDVLAAAVVAPCRGSPRRTCWSAPSPAPA